MKRVTFSLVDAFNDNAVFSKHRTLANAIKAQQKDGKRLRTRPGSNGLSYITYIIVKSDATLITREEMENAEIAAGIY